jgi:hypothetical protein
MLKDAKKTFLEVFCDAFENIGPVMNVTLTKQNNAKKLSIYNCLITASFSHAPCDVM